MENKQTTLQGWALVIASFTVVFAFSTVDHAISPLVEWLSAFFQIGQAHTLWLISSCTAGIVLGLFVGPQLLKTAPVSYSIWASLAMMAGGIWVFVSVPHFIVALTSRFVFGLGAGLFSTLLWWLAYETIDKRFYIPMITVLTAARPMAVAAGVPLVLYGGNSFGWRPAFAVMGALAAIFCFIFGLAAPKDNKAKTPFTLRALMDTYQTAWKTQHLRPFFTAMFINRLCYFGFYSMLGIWFIEHYHLNTIELAKPLVAIGLCETAINFVVPILMKIGKKPLFYGAILLNVLAFACFAWGKLSLGLTIALIGLFAMTDRIYNMLLLVFIPDIFSSSTDRTTIGRLVTLVSWGSLLFVSWGEGMFLSHIGVNPVSAFLLITLVLGFGCYIRLLRRSIWK